jgi:hypothetical protein
MCKDYSGIPLTAMKMEMVWEEKDYWRTSNTE